jgi:hypothetical protein
MCGFAACRMGAVPGPRSVPAPMVSSAGQAHDLRMSTTIMTRLRTRLHRASYDEKLAFGASPASSPELLLRAGQLLDPAQREHLAAALQRVVLEAQNQWPPAAADIVPLRHPAIRECAPELTSIVRRMRDDGEPLGVRGVAMVSQLLHDGTSPLYSAGNGDLKHRARSIRLALDVSMPAMPALADAA